MPETIPGLMKESLAWLEGATVNAYMATVEDDPRYTLIHVVPGEILSLRPEEDHHHTICL